MKVVDHDAARAEEWLEQVYMEMKGRPHDGLFQYFKGATRRDDLTIHLLNLANDIIKKVFPDTPADKAQLTESWKGERHYNAQCAQYLYYRCGPAHVFFAATHGSHEQCSQYYGYRLACICLMPKHIITLLPLHHIAYPTPASPHA
jgi:hypothetical protein